jgi:glycosyltransferase involved in cell wall biosynthesis
LAETPGEKRLRSIDLNVRKIHLLLLDTNPRGMKGSMSRYGDLVESGLESNSCSNRFKVTRVRLALPTALLEAIPVALQSLVHHAWIWLMSLVRVRAREVDLVHVLDGSHAYLVNGLGAKPVVATSHDIIPLKQMNGQFGPIEPGKFASRLILASIRGLRAATQVVAVSRCTRRDLVELASLKMEQITVVHNALDPGLVLIEKAEESDLKEADKPIVFHIGNEGFYKNRKGVVRIFARVNKLCDSRLVLAGPAPSPALISQIQKLGLADQVEFVIDPDEATISACYSNASLLLFPSIYEGFGWPPLEAMAHDCPVVCSNAASLPEVVGDAALLGPVEDEEQLAEHCLAILQNPDLAESLIQRGQKQIKQFTVEKMVEELSAVYLEVLGRNSNKARATSEAG